jgi:hypothetical protein
MFAWAIESRATAVLEAMRTEFARHSIQIDDWIVEVDSAGARVIED